MMGGSCNLKMVAIHRYPNFFEIDKTVLKEDSVASYKHNQASRHTAIADTIFKPTVVVANTAIG